MKKTKIIKKPILTIGEILDAVFSGKYDEDKIREIKKYLKYKFK